MIAIIQIDPFQIFQTYAEMPQPVVWPDGSHSHGVEPGFVRNGCAVVDVIRTPDRPNQFYDLTGESPSYNGVSLIYKLEWTPNLERALEQLLRTVDGKAEAIRLQYITPGYGQAMTYINKLAEAKAFKSDPKGVFPLLQASVGIEGATIDDVASLVMKTSSQWETLAASIENVRLGTKAKISAALTVEDAVAAYDAAVWPT